MDVSTKNPDGWGELLGIAEKCFQEGLKRGAVDLAYQEARNAHRALLRITGPVEAVSAGTLGHLGCVACRHSDGTVAFVPSDEASWDGSPPEQLAVLRSSTTPVWTADAAGDCRAVEDRLERARILYRLYAVMEAAAARS